jgi:hypothetical protein
VSEEEEEVRGWLKEGKPTHIARNECDMCAVFCDTPNSHYDEGCVVDPQHADCFACLDAAMRFGSAAMSRKLELVRQRITATVMAQVVRK